jgi:hypothetical protein
MASTYTFTSTQILGHVYNGEIELYDWIGGDNCHPFVEVFNTDSGLDKVEYKYLMGLKVSTYLRAYMRRLQAPSLSLVRYTMKFLIFSASDIILDIYNHILTL